MNSATIGSVDKTYTSVNSSGVKSIENQIQLLQQQQAFVEQSTLEDSEKEARIALLDARIVSLEQRLEIIQARETSSSSASEEPSAIQSSIDSISSDSDSVNVLYQSQGTTTSADSGISRFIAYA